MSRSVLSHVFRDFGLGILLRRFGSDQNGATAIVAALLMPVLVMGLGMGAEIGFQQMTQRSLQHAADLAAHAGGTRLRAGDPKAAIDAAALHVATKDGFVASDGSYVVNTPPKAGPDTGRPTSVEVILIKNQPRFFSAILSPEPMQIGARAVARVNAPGSYACVLALAPTLAGAVTVSGNTIVSLDGCDVASNSNSNTAFWMNNASASLSAACIYTVGKAVTSAGLDLTVCDKPQQEAPVVRDPYAGMAEPAVEGSCLSGMNKSQTVFRPDHNHPSGVKSLRICGDLDIKSKVVFEPGLYIIDGGDLSINGNGEVDASLAGLSGSGVTFYLAGSGRVQFTGNGELNIAAPTTGPFAGILIFGSRTQTGVTHDIQGNFNSRTEGAIYAPTSKIEFSGNSTSTNSCTQIIGWTVLFTGNSTLRSACTNVVARPILTDEFVKIVE